MKAWLNSMIERSPDAGCAPAGNEGNRGVSGLFCSHQIPSRDDVHVDPYP